MPYWNSPDGYWNDLGVWTNDSWPTNWWGNKGYRLNKKWDHPMYHAPYLWD